MTDDAEGWRAENDRHRALYVEAAKERDQLRAVVSRFRKANRAIDAAIEDESVDMVADELIAEHRDALDAVLDGSPDTGDDDAMVSVPLSWSDQYDELKAERDRLREAIDADRPMQIANLKALTAERDRLRQAIGRHHHDAVHVASKGLGTRLADRMLYKETGFPDVGESMKETTGLLVRMEATEAERDRLRAILDALIEQAVEAEGQENVDDYDQGNVDAWRYVRLYIEREVR